VEKVLPDEASRHDRAGMCRTFQHKSLHMGLKNYIL
jgi:hypothetical protein